MKYKKEIVNKALKTLLKKDLATLLLIITWCLVECRFDLSLSSISVLWLTTALALLVVMLIEMTATVLLNLANLIMIYDSED